MAVPQTCAEGSADNKEMLQLLLSSVDIALRPFLLLVRRLGWHKKLTPAD